MPEQSTPLEAQLTAQLMADRERLVIEQPPLEQITRRARVLRRRQTALRGAVVAAVAIFAGTVAVRAVDDSPDRHAPAAERSSAPVVDEAGVWTADGITINGLPAAPADVPGEIAQVEFADPDRGYLLSTDCSRPPVCGVHVGSTLDGGRTWKVRAAPGELAAAPRERIPLLLVLGDQMAVVSNPADPAVNRYTSIDGGEHWMHGIGSWWQSTGPPLPGGARLQLLPGPGGGPCGGTLVAWLPQFEGGVLGAGLTGLPSQPSMSVCWVSPVHAGDGAWWVGGRVDRRPAVAVSRNGGVDWDVRTFDVPGDGARVAMLGSRVYVTIVESVPGGADRLRAVYHSDDRGQRFTAPAGTGGGADTIAGDLVPLLDDRLLMVDGDGRWLLSADQGATWTHAEGLHKTARLARAFSGYVAYGMTKLYTAYSVDGSTWRKLNAT